jgi:hypothetical protein
MQILNAQEDLKLNDLDYFSTHGLSVLVFNDSYTEGHQGGIQMILHENRIAANGDLRLEQAPGQWQPFSQLDNKETDRDSQQVKVKLSYPNEEAKNRTFNRIEYPELELHYAIVVKAEGSSFRIYVDLEKPLPKKWAGKAGFNLELFPGDLFGRHYLMDDKAGIFPRQFESLLHAKGTEIAEVLPLATGKKINVAPDSELLNFSIESISGELQLIDGRGQHNNGWFVLRSTIPSGVRGRVMEWLITPNVKKDWKYGPVIHINQLGYLPDLHKVATIECDIREELTEPVILRRMLGNGATEDVFFAEAIEWGSFQRYKYYTFDFSEVKESGIYSIIAENVKSGSFVIEEGLFGSHGWQPTLRYFLPVQMCHMRVNDRYRVWHGLCHMDDARMAPAGHLHFDGYIQGSSTLNPFNEGERVPGLNSGGWHDAGDYDLRVESQAGTVYSLSLIYENFHVDYDETYIDQTSRLVELHQPDGKADILQQIEHGLLSILGGYDNLGRLYRGIICPDLSQYVLLGDGSVMTDNIPYNYKGMFPDWFDNIPDDRWVFTEDNPSREINICGKLAAASRVMKLYDKNLAEHAVEVAESLWQVHADKGDYAQERIQALVELILTTNKQIYAEELNKLQNKVIENIAQTGWTVSRILDRIENQSFRRAFTLELQKYYADLRNRSAENPFGLPYSHGTWGPGWKFQQFAIQHYFLYKNLGNNDSKEYLLKVLNFNLGVHPGINTASFVSGVGTHSTTVAYGINRDDWWYIPGGVISGTALIRPDFQELKKWPYLWQQTEYMIGGAASDMIFVMLAAEEFAALQLKSQHNF